MRLYTTGDLVRLTGLTSVTINNWCGEGWVTPVNNGRGTGTHRVFNFAQTVAVVYAQQLRKNGMRGSLVRQTLDLVANSSEIALESRLEEGKVGAFGNQFFPLSDDPSSAWMDLGTAYRKVDQYKRDSVGAS